MAAASRIDLADWSRRDPEFGALRDRDDGRRVVAMEYEPTGHALVEWLRLRDLWLDLPAHPHVLDALDRGDFGTLLLRYAAVRWDHPQVRLQVNQRARELVAEWGFQVADAMRTIVRAVPAQDAARFLRPVVRIDLGGAARVGFLPVDPGALSSSPAVDERSLVYAIGKELRSRCTGLGDPQAAEIARIIDRSLRPAADDRYQTLDEARDAWSVVAGDAAIRAGQRLASWSLAEEALGWLALGQAARALDGFEAALEVDLYVPVAELGRQRALEMLGVVHGAMATTTRGGRTVGSRVEISWSVAEERGAALEARGAFSDALGWYVKAPRDGTTDAFVDTAIARCYLALGSAQHAIDYARRALAVRSSHVEAVSIQARGYLATRDYEDAQTCAGAWCAAAPADASAHYTRGRALLARGQYLEARAAFDQAYALRPQLLEAMLLRREADRAATRVRQLVGAQPVMELPLPEHLAGLRDALANGRVAEVITALERPAYEGDASASLVHAHCLAFDGQFGAAVAMFDRASALAAQHEPEPEPEHERDAALGKARALLALHRADEALALFDRVASQAPGDLEAIEGRALALRALGRQAEAEEASRKVVAASGGRSMLRSPRVHR